MNIEQEILVSLERIANALESIANTIDVEKQAIRMFDCERGKVYATHLGKKLSEGKDAETTR